MLPKEILRLHYNETIALFYTANRDLPGELSHVNTAQPTNIDEELATLLAEAERLQTALDSVCHRIADLTRLSTLRRHAVRGDEHADASPHSAVQAAA